MSLDYHAFMSPFFSCSAKNNQKSRRVLAMVIGLVSLEKVKGLLLLHSGRNVDEFASRHNAISHTFLEKKKKRRENNWAECPPFHCNLIWAKYIRETTRLFRHATASRHNAEGEGEGGGFLYFASHPVWFVDQQQVRRGGKKEEVNKLLTMPSVQYVGQQQKPHFLEGEGHTGCVTSA